MCLKAFNTYSILVRVSCKFQAGIVSENQNQLLTIRPKKMQKIVTITPMFDDNDDKNNDNNGKCKTTISVLSD